MIRVSHSIAKAYNVKEAKTNLLLHQIADTSSNVYKAINSRMFMPRQVRDLRLVMNSTIKHASNVHMQNDGNNPSYKTSTKMRLALGGRCPFMSAG